MVGNGLLLIRMALIRIYHFAGVSVVDVVLDMFMGTRTFVTLRQMRGLASQVTVPDPARVMDWLAYLGPDPSRVMAMRQLQQQQQRQMDRIMTPFIPANLISATCLRIMTPFIHANLISAT